MMAGLDYTDTFRVATAAANDFVMSRKFYQWEDKEG